MKIGGSEQRQESGNDSLNIQAESITIINDSLSYSEVKEIAIDVFKNNFEHLSINAGETARKRAEEVTDSFLKTLADRYPDGLKQAQDPDFQLGLYTVQKEYARTGDKNLGDLLIDLLVDRAKQHSRNIEQIVLSESLSVAPKLTLDQLAGLSVIFLLKHTRNPSIVSLRGLTKFLQRNAAPFSTAITSKEICYRHLEFVGCAAISMGEIDLPDILRDSYPGLFSTGFEIEELHQRFPLVKFESRLLTPHFQDSSKRQFSAIFNDQLESELRRSGILEQHIGGIMSFSREHVVPADTVKSRILELEPLMGNIFSVWKNSLMKNMELTSVGYAIAHANLRARTKFKPDLSIWIN